MQEDKQAATSTKTGATPTPEGDLAGGEVLGLWELTVVAVSLRDGFGRDHRKLAVIIPGDTVDQSQMFYLSEDALVKRPAQTWVKNQVMAKLGGIKK